jgi:hypothetical protein
MAADSLLPTVIDHIVILVSKEDFENPPPWLGNNFKILEGGVHSGILHFTIFPICRIMKAHL